MLRRVRSLLAVVVVARRCLGPAPRQIWLVEARRLAVATGGAERPAVVASYTIADEARLLDVGERTLREWTRSGRIPTLPPIPGERGARIAATVPQELRQARPLAWDGAHLVDGAAAPPGGPQRQAEGGGEERPLAAADGGGVAHGASGGHEARGARAPGARWWWARYKSISVVGDRSRTRLLVWPRIESRAPTTAR
jgi:hypothetical protein